MYIDIAFGDHGVDAVNKYLKANKRSVSINTLVYVQSTPSIHTHILNKLRKLAQQYGLEVSIFSNNCLSILDSIDESSQNNENIILFLYDCFGDFISTSFLRSKPDAIDWKNGNGIASVSFETDSGVKVLSYVKHIDKDLSGILYMNTNSCSFTSSLTKIDKFIESDLVNEYKVIYECLDKSGLSLNDVDAFIFTNRTVKRHEAIKHRLGIATNKVFYSRDGFGHRGSLDILKNLEKALNSANRKFSEQNILISAQGMGYEWGAMLLSFPPEQ